MRGRAFYHHRTSVRRGEIWEGDTSEEGQAERKGWTRSGGKKGGPMRGQGEPGSSENSPSSSRWRRAHQPSGRRRVEVPLMGTKQRRRFCFAAAIDERLKLRDLCALLLRDDRRRLFGGAKQWRRREETQQERESAAQSLGGQAKVFPRTRKETGKPSTRRERPLRWPKRGSETKRASRGGQRTISFQNHNYYLMIYDPWELTTPNDEPPPPTPTHCSRTI